MKKAIIVYGILALMLTSCTSNNDNSNPSTSVSQPVEKINCWRCGKDLTNDVNRIETSFNPAKWECTPCYEATQKEIHDEMKAEGYYDDKEYEK
jgi:hypothetical protein